MSEEHWAAEVVRHEWYEGQTRRATLRASTLWLIASVAGMCLIFVFVEPWWIAGVASLTTMAAHSAGHRRGLVAATDIATRACAAWIEGVEDKRGDDAG
jgi:hypothetical protein